MTKNYWINTNAPVTMVTLRDTIERDCDNIIWN